MVTFKLLQMNILLGLATEYYLISLFRFLRSVKDRLNCENNFKINFTGDWKYYHRRVLFRIQHRNTELKSSVQQILQPPLQEKKHTYMYIGYTTLCSEV